MNENRCLDLLQCFFFFDISVTYAVDDKVIKIELILC